MTGLSKNKQAGMAMELFREMEHKKLGMSIGIYNIGIEGLCIAQKHESGSLMWFTIKSTST